MHVDATRAKHVGTHGVQYRLLSLCTAPSAIGIFLFMATGLFLAEHIHGVGTRVSARYLIV